MKKILQRTKNFEKSLLRLPKKIQQKFIEKLEIFLEDSYHPLLKTHSLKGDMNNLYAFSVTGDVRVIFSQYIDNEKEIITLTFIDIGTHNQVYLKF
jgi:mRNA-degrading endonuclease YafQ of YafQ-DinJ toxin-antitoxin module